MRAWPRRNVPPFFSNRRTAISSSQSAVASRMRPATDDQSGVTLAVPATLPTRCASARALPARTMILEGMQPQ